MLDATQCEVTTRRVLTRSGGTLTRMTSGNLRLLTRLLTRIERVLSVNDAQVISFKIVEAARDSLVIGHA
jgi:hypothetical protein